MPSISQQHRGSWHVSPAPTAGLGSGPEGQGGSCLDAGQSAAMPATTRGVLDRRRFLAAGGAAAALLITDRLAGAWPAPAQRGGYPFTLGVASGDPGPGGMVLW